MINIKKTLQSRKLAPKKKLGQNFLVHPETAARIVQLAGVNENDTIVELGVGLGSLTTPLAEQAAKVIGLEIDRGIIKWLQDEGGLADNVTLIHQDLLKADFKKLAQDCGGRLKIIANLPYSISNPLLFKLIENRDIMEWAVLMLQKEVGMRIRAKSGTKEYGVLTVLLGGCADVETLMHLGPGQFHPRPKVDSVVTRIQFHPMSERVAKLPPYDETVLRKIVNAGFQKRRKTLVNGLSTSPLLSCSKKEIIDVLKKIGLAPDIRPERLTIEDFVGLTRELSG
ncbi:MAG: 16S rRNA (adenine(1518)-N(6)/adenine(1519)-N(6))-dimethyltransferase RsmA [Thermodesulfobacteriota bacterium]|nr:16S rRNA (adenine(1518)-N(6)/adenine(1519)-N(6))-dimethyltransferase RsmA [Thermodesulfobacteriota bacterium]